MRLERIDQVAIAVDDLDAAIEFWQRVFGATLDRREVVASDQIEEAMLQIGDGYLQLIAPTSDDSTVARYVARHGPGLHHVGFAVASLAEALDHLKEHGVRLIDSEPRPGGGGHLIAFVHPEATGGVLVELVEGTTRPQATEAPGRESDQTESGS